MSTFFQQYESYREAFETALNEYCRNMQYRPAILNDGMQYSLLCGGKRIRPILFLATLDMLGVNWQKEMNYAIALECIHTYSLIHDDLPAMDNDDFRRGRLSNHKQFGEANAILAGDALLNEAFTLLLQGAIDEPHRKSAEFLSRCAGADGMIGGQSLDLLCEKATDVGETELLTIYLKKTGKLIVAPLVMAAELAGVSVTSFQNFGENLGILFQLTDDLLDAKGDSNAMGKTTGKDLTQGKLTCAKVYGLEQSIRLVDRYVDCCHACLSDMSYDTDFLENIVQFVRTRNN